MTAAIYLARTKLNSSVARGRPIGTFEVGRTNIMGKFRDNFRRRRMLKACPFLRRPGISFGARSTRDHTGPNAKAESVLPPRCASSTSPRKKPSSKDVVSSTAWPGPWASLTWRFNSGLALPCVVPDYASALKLDADQQAQMGLHCGDVYATRFAPITSCNSLTFGTTRVSIPPPGKENDDLRPTRVTERNIFDAAVGIDDLLHKEGYKIQLRFVALNLTNKEALYNFLSTFSGTHFVTPRALQVELRLVF